MERPRRYRTNRVGTIRKSSAFAEIFQQSKPARIATEKG